MQKSHHIGPIASLISGFRSFKEKCGESKTAQAAAQAWAKFKDLDIVRQKNALQDYTFEVANCVSYGGSAYAEDMYPPCYPTTMENPNVMPARLIPESKMKVIEDYLSTLRDIITQNADFKISADILPFDQGVILRLILGTKEGNNYKPGKENIVEASNHFGIDINKYSAEITSNKPVNKRTYVILSDRNTLYLIKGFAPENWGLEGVNRDIAAIKGATL